MWQVRTCWDSWSLNDCAIVLQHLKIRTVVRVVHDMVTWCFRHNQPWNQTCKIFLSDCFVSWIVESCCTTEMGWQKGGGLAPARVRHHVEIESLITLRVNRPLLTTQRTQERIGKEDDCRRLPKFRVFWHLECLPAGCHYVGCLTSIRVPELSM